MSIVLAATQFPAGAVSSITFLPTGNYALTDIQTLILNCTPTAAAGIVWLANLSCGGTIFHQLAFTANGGAATPLLAFPFPSRSFADPLILPRGSPILFNIATVSNITSINILLNISGFILP